MSTENKMVPFGLLFVCRTNGDFLKNYAIDKEAFNNLEIIRSSERV